MDSQAHGQQELLGCDGQRFKMEVECNDKVIQLVFKPEPCKCSLCQAPLESEALGKGRGSGSSFPPYKTSWE